MSERYRKACIVATLALRELELADAIDEKKKKKTIESFTTGNYSNTKLRQRADAAVMSIQSIEEQYKGIEERFVDQIETYGLKKKEFLNSFQEGEERRLKCLERTLKAFQEVRCM